MYTCKHALAKQLFKEGKVAGSNTQKRPSTLATQFKSSVAGTVAAGSTGKMVA